MPALAADVAAATRPNGFSLDVQESAGVLAAYPNARDGADAPALGFWDTLADATALNGDRFALLSAPRRRFRVVVEGIQTALSAGDVTPASTLVASELTASGPFLVARVDYDLETNRTTLELWG